MGKNGLIAKRLGELDLNKFHQIFKDSNHKRYKVFRNKGTQCIRCGIHANKVIVYIGWDEGIHIDLVREDENGIVLFTIDHRQPKSKNGSNDIANCDPMCLPCNQRKGNKIGPKWKNVPED